MSFYGVPLAPLVCIAPGCLCLAVTVNRLCRECADVLAELESWPLVESQRLAT